MIKTSVLKEVSKNQFDIIRYNLKAFGDANFESGDR